VRYAIVAGEKQGHDELLHLSIHRRDRNALRDWRHFQSIKNEIAGPERTAVEVYPPEGHLLDSTNEFHLWVLPARVSLPFGFEEGRHVSTPEQVEELNRQHGGRARQRPWQEGLSTGPSQP